MSRASRRVLSIVLVAVAIACLNAAATFYVDLHGESLMAHRMWRLSPTVETEAALQAALASKRRTERRVRVAFGVGGVALGAAAVVLMVSKPRNPEVFGLQGRGT